MPCHCTCLGSRALQDELKLWVPFIILTGVWGVAAAVAGDAWIWVVIAYACYFAFNFCAAAYMGYWCNHGWMPAYVNCDKRLDGKTAIVTGANSGSGYETAKDFYKRGAHVILTTRSRTKAETAIQNITQDLRGIDKVGSMDYVLMDLCSKKSVDAAIADIQSKKVDISILVNNAGGILSTKMTEDKLEAMWQANYYSPFYLTKKLLPNIKATAKRDQFGRIVNTASVAHATATEKQIDGFINGETDLQYWQNAGNSYGATKCGQILYTMKLQELLNNENDGNGQKYGDYLWVTSNQPGYINSNFYAKGGWLIQLFFRLFYPFQAMFGMVTPKQGAQTNIHLSISDNNIKPGGYHALCKPQNTRNDTLIPSRKDSLYDASIKLWD